jgi:hypothetical protein
LAIRSAENISVLRKGKGQAGNIYRILPLVMTHETGPSKAMICS